MRKYTTAAVESAKIYACTVSGCSFSSANKHHLSMHLRRVHFGKFFKCSKCDYETRASYNMKYHEVLHSGKKPETCHVCEKKFTHTSALRVHIGSKHPEVLGDQNLLKCTQCNFRSAIPSLIRQHMFKHRCEQSDHYCATCDKYFPAKSTLRDHLQSKKHLRLKSQATHPPSDSSECTESQVKPEPIAEIPSCSLEPVPIAVLQDVPKYIVKRYSKLQRRLQKQKPFKGAAFRCRFCPWSTDDVWAFITHLRKLTIVA